MITRSDQRFRTASRGVDSWHCFSAGAYYDLSRMGFGALIGADEHVLAPGAGFAEHAHRGVDIISLVLVGTLGHAGPTGDLLVSAGDVLVQSTGTGLRHGEVNASTTEALRFLQLTVRTDRPDVSIRRATSPVSLSTARLRLVSGPVTSVAWLFVVDGTAAVDGETLGPGDSAALDGTADVTGRAIVFEPMS